MGIAIYAILVVVAVFLPGSEGTPPPAEDKRAEPIEVSEDISNYSDRRTTRSPSLSLGG